jgi:hypothetical protein
MASEVRGDDVWFRYRAIDIRELDGERLLESEEVRDNVIAILARIYAGEKTINRPQSKMIGSTIYYG